jgi:hypothetical protein
MPKDTIFRDEPGLFCRQIGHFQPIGAVSPVGGTIFERQCGAISTCDRPYPAPMREGQTDCESKAEDDAFGELARQGADHFAGNPPVLMICPHLHPGSTSHRSTLQGC